MLFLLFFSQLQKPSNLNQIKRLPEHIFVGIESFDAVLSKEEIEEFMTFQNIKNLQKIRLKLRHWWNKLDFFKSQIPYKMDGFLMRLNIQIMTLQEKNSG